jgi:hypothetical protein
VEKPSVKQGLPVEKKHALTAAFISGLLLSVVAGTHFVNMGKANPTVYEMKYLPTISIHSPANNTYINANEILLNFTITRPKGWEMTMSASDWTISQELQRVSIQVDGKFIKEVNVNSNLSSAPFNHFVYLANLTDGEHNIIVHAFASGFEYAQWWSSPYSFQISNSSLVHFTLDTVSPAIQILSIENKTYYTSDLLLNFTVDEFFTKVTYVLDGQENRTMTENFTLSGLPVGRHNITVYAWDVAGNLGASETVAFNIAKPEPEPFPTKLVAAASVATVVVGDVGLLIYFKKRRREAARYED